MTSRSRLASDSSTDSSDLGVPEITRDALPADTLAALNAHISANDSLKAEEGRSDDLCTGGLISEDFGLSQFWYDDDTQRALAKEILRRSQGGRAAIISAPSVMNGIKLLQSDGWKCSEDVGATVFILEYDRRFDRAYPDSFVYYDFNDPTGVPQELQGSVDCILMDPPYLREDVVEGFLETAHFMARKSGIRSQPTEESTAGTDRMSYADDEGTTPMIFVTSPLNEKFLRKRAGLRRTPYHLGFRSKFATPMSVYTNYVSEELGGWVQEENFDDERIDGDVGERGRR